MGERLGYPVKKLKRKKIEHLLHITVDMLERRRRWREKARADLSRGSTTGDTSIGANGADKTQSRD